jgi:acyl-coenzyme A thioesterase PaaI-like protein
MKTNRVLALHKRVTAYPFGQRIFSRMVSRMAPYFATIHPQITHLSDCHCEVLIRKRKKVTNHIGTVHVIAIANGLEMAMGTMAEASVPSHLRWLPKGMSLEYSAKAGTDIRCVAKVQPSAWQAGNLIVPVVAYDEQDVVVVQGTITLWITEKPNKQDK